MANSRGVGPLYITLNNVTSNSGGETLNGTTAGNALIFVILWYDPAGTIAGPTLGIAGESNGTLIAGSKFTNNTAIGNVSGQIGFLANNTGGGNKAITITFASQTYADIAVMEYAGLDTAGQPDNSTSASGATTATTNLTTNSNNALIVAGGINNSSDFTAGSGYVLFGGGGMPNTLYNEEAEDQLDMGSAASKAVAFTGFGTNWAITAASFKTASGAALAVTITSPTSLTSYNNGNVSTIDIGGTATAATSVTWTNDRGGSGSATNTGTSYSTWTITGIALQLGDNFINITAGDGSTTTTDGITVTYTAAPENCRGFSTIYGSATTDKIVSALTVHATQRTYVMWLNHHGGTNNRIFAKQNSGGTQIEMFYVVDTTHYNYLRSWSGGDNLWQVTFGTVPLDEWHHWAVTYDAGNVNNDPLIYLDGISQTVTQSAGPTSGTVGTNTDSYHIGNRGAGDRVFNGMIQDFAIWDRILSAAEILDLATGAAVGYQGKSPLYYPTSLVEYIPLNDSPVTSEVLANPTVTGTAQQTGLAIDFPTFAGSLTATFTDNLAGGELS